MAKKAAKKRTYRASKTTASKSPKKSTQTKQTTSEAVSPTVNNKLADVDVAGMRNNLLMNAILSRSQFLSDHLNTERDVYKECQYPELGTLTIKHYKDMYEREPVAARVVELLPEESWMVTPKVYETEDEMEETPFEQGWKTVASDLTGGSRLKSEKGNKIWSYLKRLDILSGIGTFGVMVLGTDDGKPLSEPLEFKPGPTARLKLIYLRVYDQSKVSITEWEEEQTSPRIGEPVMYSIQLTEENQPLKQQQTDASKVSSMVHWTRVIHRADNLGSSESFGVPRQQQVYNRLWDLVKLYGGQAEMYWKGAFPGLSIESHPQLGGDVEIDKDDIANQINDMQNGLERYLAIGGGTVNSLAPQVMDPTPHISTTIEAICIKLAVPVRIFKGSERGELSSSQDKGSWNEVISNRHNTNLTPDLISVLIDRLIDVNVLPEPPEGYHVDWPDLNTLDEASKAEILLKRTQALSAYLVGGVEAAISLEDFLVKEMEYTREEVKELMENIDEQLKELITQDREANLLELKNGDPNEEDNNQQEQVQNPKEKTKSQGATIPPKSARN